MQEKSINGHSHVLYDGVTYAQDEMIHRTKDFYTWMDQRRTVRDISDRPVSIAAIENIILAAGTSPSGAHKQPWTFCVVRDPALKSKIREAAEKEEYESYHRRMSERWKNDLKPLATNWDKPFLE
ncbi:MAG: nitroreductase family protein, partial [Bacteroidota bacterium]